MNRVFVFVLLSLSIFIGCSDNHNPDKFLGTWKRFDKSSKYILNIKKDGNQVFIEENSNKQDKKFQKVIARYDEKNDMLIVELFTTTINISHSSKTDHLIISGMGEYEKVNY